MEDISPVQQPPRQQLIEHPGHPEYGMMSREASEALKHQTTETSLYKLKARSIYDQLLETIIPTYVNNTSREQLNIDMQQAGLRTYKTTNEVDPSVWKKANFKGPQANFITNPPLLNRLNRDTSKLRDDEISLFGIRFVRNATVVGNEEDRIFFRVGVIAHIDYCNMTKAKIKEILMARRDNRRKLKKTGALSKYIDEE